MNHNPSEEKLSPMGVNIINVKRRNAENQAIRTNYHLRINPDENSFAIHEFMNAQRRLVLISTNCFNLVIDASVLRSIFLWCAVDIYNLLTY